MDHEKLGVGRGIAIDKLDVSNTHVCNQKKSISFSNISRMITSYHNQARLERTLQSILNVFWANNLHVPSLFSTVWTIC